MTKFHELKLLEDKNYLLEYEVKGLIVAAESEIVYELHEAKIKEKDLIVKRISDIKQELNPEKDDD